MPMQHAKQAAQWFEHNLCIMPNQRQNYIVSHKLLNCSNDAHATCQAKKLRMRHDKLQLAMKTFQAKHINPTKTTVPSSCHLSKSIAKKTSPFTMTTPIRVIEQPVEKLPQLPKLELLQNPTAVITFLRAT